MRRQAEGQAVSRSLHSSSVSLLTQPQVYFLTAFLGICQGFWGLRGGKGSSFSGGRGEGSTKQMTFKLDLRGKQREELS